MHQLTFLSSKMGVLEGTRECVLTRVQRRCPMFWGELSLSGCGLRQVYSQAAKGGHCGSSIAVLEVSGVCALRNVHPQCCGRERYFSSAFEKKKSSLNVDPLVCSKLDFLEVLWFSEINIL